MLLGFTFNLLTIVNSNKDQFVDHPTTIKILVKFYLPQAAQVKESTPTKDEGTTVDTTTILFHFDTNPVVCFEVTIPPVPS